MRASRSERKAGSDKVDQVAAFMGELEKAVLTIEVTKATENELRALIEAHLWSAPEGLRLVLGAGIGALTAAGLPQAATDAEKGRQLTRLLAETQGKLAGARYELSEAREQLKRWDLSSGAIARIARELEATLQRQNTEIDRLNALLQAKDQEIQALQGQLRASGK